MRCEAQHLCTPARVFFFNAVRSTSIYVVRREFSFIFFFFFTSVDIRIESCHFVSP
jgi:hypothetical protein